MKASKIIIKNLFGITEKQLDGSSVELIGGNGTGKTSVIDAIRYALTNRSDREYIVRNGETEGCRSSWLMGVKSCLRKTGRSCTRAAGRRTCSLLLHGRMTAAS